VPVLSEIAEKLVQRDGGMPDHKRDGTDANCLANFLAFPPAPFCPVPSHVGVPLSVFLMAPAKVEKSKAELGLTAVSNQKCKGYVVGWTSGATCSTGKDSSRLRAGDEITS
jgi:hypothetical protein